MNKGLLIILSGPSEVGKGTVVKELMKDKTLNLSYSISMTTRAPRNGEVDGREYFFISKEGFEKKIEQGELLEFAEFVNNYYGTPKAYVEQMLDSGHNILLEIETKGAQQVMEKMKGNNVISIFLLPPSLYDLELRIRNRRTESDEVIKERLDKANKELQLKSLYDYNVINDVPLLAAKKIADIIRNHLIK
ncbi:MAG TPA: guanylate kinase [Clostridiales bacterium]|nr:guanylate kinase [Clostridiales bacterium]